MDKIVCKRCVMDNVSDPTITFNQEGFCNYCTDAIRRMSNTYFPNSEGYRILEGLISRLKKDGKGKQFDCIMGLSGGLDSSYLAYLGAVKWGLRILALHIDDGFDTPIAKENIQMLCKKANIELKTIIPNSLQFNDLSKSFILAGVPNIAIPQDNVIFAYIYKEARKTKVKNFLSGGNFALESILEQGNTHTAFDVVNIYNIHKKFGQEAIPEIPLLSLFRKGILNKFILKINTYRPLNYIDYNKEIAIKDLNKFCNFNYYGSKHLENYFTAFTQLYWFPNKFGVDKRKSHLSSMIVSGQLTRDEAVIELGKPLYDKIMMNIVIELIKSKLKFSDTEFTEIMNSIPKQHTDYKTSLFNRLVYKYYFQKSLYVKQK